MLKLYMNELGLLRTEDGLWGIRGVGLKHYAIQHRLDRNDPWGWEILTYKSSKEEAVAYLTKYLKAQSE